MIKLSVIIPLFNGQDTILRAIHSVENQSMTVIYEIIVVNDGSTDCSERVVRDYISLNNNRKIFLFNKDNGGAASARNYGIQKSKGEFIALLDADDEWEPDKLRVQFDLLRKNKDVVLVGTTFNGKIYNDTFLKKFKEEAIITFKDQIFKNYFQPSTVIFRKNILNKTGLFPENQRYAEEGRFFFEVTKFYKCVLINQSYLIFGSGKRGFGHSGLSANLKEMQKGEIMNLIYVKRKGYITNSLFVIAIIYSYLKYLRRLFIQFLGQI
ncbi:glycosyltransferase family 2 protein [Bacteroides fragilis]